MPDGYFREDGFGRPAGSAAAASLIVHLHRRYGVDGPGIGVSRLRNRAGRSPSCVGRIGTGHGQHDSGVDRSVVRSVPSMFAESCGSAAGVNGPAESHRRTVVDLGQASKTPAGPVPITFVVFLRSGCAHSPTSESHHRALPPRPLVSTSPYPRNRRNSACTARKPGGFSNPARISWTVDFFRPLRISRICRCLSLRSWLTRSGG